MENEPRRGHPYHMHDAILAQPDAFARAAQRNEDSADRFVDLSLIHISEPTRPY